MKQFRLLAASLFFAAFILCSASFVSAANPGSPAPAFTLTDISGKKISLSELKGKVVLLNFWATWCGPCKAEMPALNRLYIELKDKGFVILAVSLDTAEKPVKSFIAEKKLAFPVLMDSDKELSFDLYAVMGLPTTFIIDKKGIIVERILGDREWDAPQMKDKILKLLSGR
ncbi:MAG: TlpA disulfide reductase family protein [Nitrospirota bacterium]